MTSSASGPARRLASAWSAGPLRLLVLFHEAHDLGAGRSVLQAVPHLEELGWTVGGWFPGDGPLVSNAARRLAYVTSAVRPLAYSRHGWRRPPGVRRRLVGTPAYFRALRRALDEFRPNVVHANTLLALPEATVARTLGLPLVVQVHEHANAGAKARAARRSAAGVADVVVCVSDTVAELVRRSTKGTPVVTVRNGVAARQRLSSVTRRPLPLVGTVATVSRTKGTDIFLRAAALAAEQRRDLSFEHVGDADLHGDDALDRDIAELRRAPGLSDRLSFLGSRDASQLIGRWQTFVLASRSEAFPLVVLEAMAAGVPVVATEVGGVPEQIEHLASGILVPPEDPETLAYWIVRLHDDAALRARLADRAAARVRRCFQTSRQAEGLHEAYLSAVALRFGPPSVRRHLRAHLARRAEETKTPCPPSPPAERPSAE